MNASDYKARLTARAGSNAGRWGRAGTGHIQLALQSAKFLPAIDRRSPAPRGRIVDVETGAYRVALPGEIAEWCRLMAGPKRIHRAIIWDALQGTPWQGGKA